MRKLMFIIVSVLALVCLLVPYLMSARLSAEIDAMSSSGHDLFSLQVQNRVEHEANAAVPLVDGSSCSNTLEYVRKLIEQTGGSDADKFYRAAGQWVIALNVPEDAPDVFPVMFSANFDPSVLPREWDGEMDAIRHLEVKPIGGVDLPNCLSGNRVFVICKGGAAQMCDARYLTLLSLFHIPYKLPENACFLTPVGKVWPRKD